MCVLTPDHILQWMNVKNFGAQNLPVNANPISARSSSLQYWKKAICAGQSEGNPTRIIEINKLIKQVKKKEVQNKALRCRLEGP
jgi:hypothetical protein